jgi:PIN domain nuclease of toxin-antitoxin system
MADRRTGELILLDTHIWVWSILEPANLNKLHQLLINSESDRLAISIVTCWEISMLSSKGRLNFDVPLQQWFENSIAESEVIVLPLSPRITADAYELPGTFHDDPADRMIVATARSRDCLLLTEDKKIRDYPYVRTA